MPRASGKSGTRERGGTRQRGARGKTQASAALAPDQKRPAHRRTGAAVRAGTRRALKNRLCHHQAAMAGRNPHRPICAAAPEPVSMLISPSTIVALFLLLLVIVAILQGIRQVPQGFHWTSRALRQIHQDPASRPQPHRPVHRPHRQQGEHDGAGDRRAEPGGHHQGQRHRARRWRDLLPGDRRRPRLLRGGGFADRPAQPRDDQHPLGHGVNGPRPAALPP